ncbi:MAG: hypothetical protein CL940_12535 [Deltaproteobacteria bacterium]|nr:hypothetical protein [Deltaproteobacteria bacterium]
MNRTIILWVALGTLALSGACSEAENTGGSSADVQSGDISFAEVQFNPSDVEPPTVAIQTPFEGQLFQEGDPVPLVATVLDDLDLPATLTVTWHSNLDGELVVVEPNDEGFAVVDHEGLSAGNHTITASARDNSGKVAQSSVGIIVNGAPEAPIVVITPENPSTVDNLEAVLSVPAIDPNRGQEEIFYSWRWFRDGEDMDVPIPTVYAQKTKRGEVWEVRVRASDPYGKSTEITASVTIENQRPSCGQAVVLPSTGWTDTSFACSCPDWDDGDPGDLPSDTCQWMVSGVLQDSDGSCELASTETSKGQTVSCLITPSDGTDTGDTSQSATVSILNSAPSKPDVSLGPDSGDALTVFSCSVLGESTDADGDSVTYETNWIVNGYINPGSTTANVYPSNLVSEENGPTAGKGDTVRCRVRATDGDAASAWIDSSSVILSNAPPQGGLALVGPSNATEADEIVCQTTAVEDPDGDEVSWTYVWKVDGEVLEGQTGESLPPNTVPADSTVVCEATPDDGEANGETITSKNQVTVSNAPPTVPELAIEAPAGSEGPVLCVMQEEPTDATEVTVTTEWTLGSDDPFEGEDHLEADLVSSCDIVACRISVSDGEETLWSEWVQMQLPVGVDCDDGDPCTSHSCLPLGGCMSSQNTDPCDDDDACTVNDTCAAGQCVGEVKSCDDSNPCTVDACDPTAGCTHATDLGQCDDGNTCTIDSCNPQTGGCSWVPVVDGTSCNADSDGCTLLDTCNEGICQPGSPAPCGIGTTACKLLACQSTSPDTYTCETLMADDTVPCDDGFFCTVDDACDGAGACLGGPARDCSQGQGACNIGLCDELNNECKIIPRDDGTPCDADGNGCTQGDACSEGLCLAGDSADCSALDADCSQGSCVPLGAEGYECSLIPAPAGLPCDDGDPCTVTAACDGGGSCSGGIELDCEALLGSQCQTGYCDPVAQGCVVVKILDGTPCDDDNLCSTDDACQNGLCLGQGDACGEEQISVEVSSNRQAALGDLGFGRYVTQWSSTALKENVLRITDRTGSREREEQELEDVLFSPTVFPLSIATHVNGNFLTLGHDGEFRCIDSANSNCTVQGAARGVLYDLYGNPLYSEELWEISGEKGTGEGLTNFVITQHITPFSFSDGSWAALLMVTNNSSTATTPEKNRMYFAPIGAQLLTGDLIEVLGEGEVADDLYAATEMPGDEIAVVWVDPTRTQIYGRTMDRFGTWLGDGPVLVHETDDDDHLARIEIATENGNSVVLSWDVDRSDGGDPNRDVEALVLDASLQSSSPVLEISGKKSKDQLLGGLDVFSDGGFVVVFQDEAGDVSGSGVLASRYDASQAPLGKSIVHLTVFDDQQLPSVLVLPGDDYVVSFLGPDSEVYTRRFDQDGSPAIGALEQRALVTTDGDQRSGDGAQDGQGNSVLVVQSPFAGNSGTEIVARRFNSGGLPISDEFMVNGALEGDQTEPTIAGNANGYVVIWAESGATPGVRGRLLNADGSFASDDFEVSETTATPTQPGVSLAADGRFVVVWAESDEIFARSFHADATPASDAFQVDATVSHEQTEPVTTEVLDDDHVVIAWVASASPGAKTKIYARKVSVDGALSEAEAIQLGANETSNAIQDEPSVARGPGNAGLACWHSTAVKSGKAKKGVGCQLFGLNAIETIGEVFEAHDEQATGDFSAPDVIQLQGGQFAVAFQLEDVDGDEHGIQVQRLSDSGLFTGTRIVANRTWSGDQTEPFLVRLTGAGTPYVVGWESAEPDADEADVLFRILKAE